VLVPDIHIEGSADTIEEHGEYVSGADLDHTMQFEDESSGGTESGLTQGCTDGQGVGGESNSLDA
jgi:hypothetical protein